MLNLTKRVDYGLIALTHLAHHNPGRASAREVAIAYGLSQPLAANVLKELARAGFVRSVRGTKGGYELSVEPASISVGRLVEALEGPVRLAECIGDHGDESGACCVSARCPVKGSVFRVHARIHEVLHGITIGDLAGQEGGAGERLPVPSLGGACAGVAPPAGEEKTP